MIYADTIKKNFDLFKTRLTTSPGMEGDLHEDDLSGEGIISAPPENEQPSAEGARTENTPVSDQIVAIIDSAERTEIVEPESPRDGDTAGQVTQTQLPVQTPPSVTQTQPPRTESMRERSIYFTQIDKDGQILQSKVARRVPVTETPLMDALNIMLAGPSTDEINRGILNLIPRGTRLLNATVRGNTAYLSFSEDFLFNTFGVEGYVAQLRQIVWTVTEFPNVNDVQLLIEGRRIDYLGEGIYIGSPISRQSF